MDSANAAPRHTSLARRANVKRRTATASTSIDRTSNTDAVCEPTILPHTAGLSASDGVPATTFAPYRPNDPSDPTRRNAHANHSNMRFDAESADCTASTPPPTNTINPISASSRAPVSSRPTVELAAAFPLTLSMSAPTSTPDWTPAPVPTWKLKTPSTTWPSAEGTRHTTTYTPAPIDGTDACTVASPPAAASGAPVGINVAFSSYSSMSASPASTASLKTSWIVGGPVSRTALAAGTLATRPACAETCDAGANPASATAAPVAMCFQDISW